MSKKKGWIQDSRSRKLTCPGQGGEEGRDQAHDRGRSYWKMTIQGWLLIFTLKNSGNGNAIYLFRRGYTGRRTDSEGKDFVLNMMKSGHGRQLVSRIWSLGEMGQRERHLRVSNIDSFLSHFHRVEELSLALHCFVKFKHRNQHIALQDMVPVNLSESFFPHPVRSGPIILLAIAQIETFRPLDLGTWYFLHLEYLLSLLCLVDLTNPSKSTPQVTCSGKPYTTLPFLT